MTDDTKQYRKVELTTQEILDLVAKDENFTQLKDLFPLATFDFMGSGYQVVAPSSGGGVWLVLLHPTSGPVNWLKENAARPRRKCWQFDFSNGEPERDRLRIVTNAIVADYEAEYDPR